MKVKILGIFATIFLFSYFFYLPEVPLRAQAALPELNELLIRKKSSPLIEKIRYDTPDAAKSALLQYQSDPEIFLAQYNYPYQVDLAPNDKYFTEQDYLEQIKAPLAWNKINKSPKVTVAIIDTGVDIYHPDLAESIWINQDEVKGDGIDNDGNGYIDDYQGWDFLLNLPDPRPKFGGTYSALGINHGTVVAGVIGALGDNNFGISGLSWQIKLMPLRALNSEGAGDTITVIKAIEYAVANGADIINLSVVGSNNDPLLGETIKEAYEKGVMIIAAAGNETADSAVEDLDFYPCYPVCHDGDGNYILGVGSVDENDVKSSFSNYGISCLDLVAPGENFFSTLVYQPTFPDYRDLFGGYWSGTSVAAPLVSGTAALIKGLRPDLINSEIYQIIKSSADFIDDKNPLYQGQLGGGRLNVEKAIKTAENYVSPKQNLVLAPAAKHSPLVKIVNAQGQVRTEFFAYSENFQGGVNLAVADVNNDNQKEIITGAGRGGGPHVKVFSFSGELLKQFFTYENNFIGGVNLAAGDVDGDGLAEIVTAPQSNYRPLIKIYGLDNKVKNQFLAFAENYRSGLNVTLGDINADGRQEIIVTRNQGAPLVKIFDAQGKLIQQFTAFETNFLGGIKISAYNLYGDKRTELIAVPLANYQPLVRIFSPNGNLEYQWSVNGLLNSSGLNVIAGKLQEGKEAEIIISQTLGNTNEVIIFNYIGQEKNRFSPYESGFGNGINLSL